MSEASEVNDIDEGTALDHYLVRKRSVRISGHATSITLEDAFWNELKSIAKRDKKALSTLISEIDEQQNHINLSSALRLFVLSDLKTRLKKKAPSKA